VSGSGPSGRSRTQPPVPYTWRVGVDNAFGYLTLPGGQAHLTESRRFLSGTGLTVSLDDGSVLLTIADGTSVWQPIAPERACELAGIPAPDVDGEAETARRLDPFHVERHTSPLFNALVALAVENRLPCAHALRAWREGVWDGTFDGPYLEQPETFAASVLEYRATTQATVAGAVVAQLANDAMLNPASPEHKQLITDTAWETALAELPGRLSQLADALERRRQTRRDAARSNGAQLALI
jgi:hypothetical protein